ncbi:isopenicillin N synthase family dioxygenase [Brevibacillus dissolubilis]|uniref:isopenicillin N synthase family dioxygenase n=1 Tax=Brevibacillus dissolubilis TaxID=1844116 RepID=UPI0011176247|nr:2-oxoglutarate and iron-dependent oxygenase domain-containing protein [Brevibacillus dissolubilis]
MAKALANIPTLNLQKFVNGTPEERAQFVQEFGEGLKAIGFIKLEGHGIDSALIRNTYDAFEKFFALPTDVKEKYVHAQGGARGYTGFGKEHAKNRTAGDLKEFWHTGQDLPENHPLYNTPAYPPNIWPEAEIQGITENTLGLYRALENCAAQMLTALALYFNLEEDYFTRMIKDGNSVLRSLHYPPLEPGMDPNAVRAAEHEDINLITLLCEATQSGLEILTHDGEWLGVEALEGQIVVDAGDMLSRMANGVIPATTHRVVNPEGEAAKVSRYSVPFFTHPRPECVLEIIPGTVTEENPLRAPVITAGEFLNQRLREIGLLK